MRRRAITAALLVAGLFSGLVASAGADLPPLPTVPTLPPVPTLPVQLPAPPAHQTPPAPLPEPPQVPPVAHPALPLGGAGGQGTSSGSGSSSGRAAAASPRGTARHAGSRPSRVSRLHFSRNWISRTGRKQRRQTVLVFTLRRASLVEFVVVQIAPDCRRIGRFRVVGRPGVNRVRFRGRIGRVVLAPGTYRITARMLPGGRTLANTRLVVVQRPESGEIASRRRADACGSGARQSSTGSPIASTSTPAKPGSTTARGQGKGKAEEQARTSRARGVLGARFTRAADVVRSIPLWLFVLLGLAIALLAVASVPLRAAPTRRGASALARHRSAVAIAGAATLVAVTVAYALH